MDKKDVKRRIGKLRKLVNHYRHLYHVLDRQEISEAALDSLKKELFDLEQRFPEFITSDSPTQRIGGKPLEKFRKIKHPVQMLSFNDAFSKEDMTDWLERISKLLNKEEIREIDYYCEPKLDGLAIELIYENSVLKVGSTRGNGIIGEDVTQNLKTIESIPLSLREIDDIVKDLRREGLEEIAKNIEKGKIKEIVVKGEAVITKNNFDLVNKGQRKKNLATFANPRNLAAGSIRQLNPKITAQRKLDVTVYDLITDFGQETHAQEHEILHILGFKTNNKYSKHCKNLDEVFEFHNFWQKKREKLPYEIDGLVVTINRNKIFEKLGVIGKAPRGAVAFKFALKQATTKVLDIKVQIGRTGALTPVAHLKPVRVGGVTISRATLHNEDEIKRLGLKIGDTVIVGRAGDVIPDIVKVLPELRTGREKIFRMPLKCPVCENKLLKPKGEVIRRCPNPRCFAKMRRYFYHFVSRGAFDIPGLGPKIINRLIDERLVSDPADIFELEEGDLISLERFAEKSVKNLVEAIQSRKTITLPKFIYSLGIRNVGEETAQDLAEKFGSLERLKKSTPEDLMKIKDVGPIVSRSIHEWFSQRKNINFLEKLKKTGIEIGVQRIKPSSQKLKGLTFVLTGSLETMTRDLAKDRIRELGGEISESVSKRTDYLLIGRDPGSKYDKAKNLGIKIISEQEFLKLIRPS